MSGWSDSGIDWGSLETSRTEVIVWELFQAVYERDYWLRYWQGSYLRGAEPLPNRSVSDYRLETARDYIFTTIKRWLMTEDEILDKYQGQNGYILQAEGCLFMDFNQSPNSYPTEVLEERDFLRNYLWGMSCATIDSIPVDLSFLEDFEEPYLGRINIDELKLIYDFMQLPFKVFACQQVISNYQGNSYISTTLDGFTDGNIPSIGISSESRLQTEGGTAYQDAYQDYENDSTSDRRISGLVIVSNFKSWEINASYQGLFSAATLINSGRCLLGSATSATDFDLYLLDCYVYGYSYIDRDETTGNASYSPPSGYGTNSRDGEVFPESGILPGRGTVDYFNLSGWRVDLGTPFVANPTESNEDTNGVSFLSYQNHLPTIDFNKEGYIKYYTTTEPDD